MSYRPPKFPWPFIKDEETKTIKYHIVSGWPAVMMGPRRVEECFPGYKGYLCSHSEWEKLQNEQEESN